MNVGVIVESQDARGLIGFECGFEGRAQAVFPDVVARRGGTAGKQALGQPQGDTAWCGVKKVGEEEFFEAKDVIAVEMRNDHGINVCERDADCMQRKWAEQTAVEKAYTAVNANDGVCVVIMRRFGTCVSCADKLKRKMCLIHKLHLSRDAQKHHA